MKSKMTPGRWVALALLLCIISTLGASYVQTSGGTVTVKDLRWETPSGKLMSALLFIPGNATAKTPAPAIITSHGWYNNREMQDMNYVEYARRGYVVVSMDMYGHGNSDVLTGSPATRATGMTDVVELVAALPYVDKAKIGVTGHSNGARAANYAVDDDNKKSTPLIHAVLLVANDPTYKDANGKYFNKYGSRDVAVVAAQYDEFFFRNKLANGATTPPRDYINQPTAQSFLNFGVDPLSCDQPGSQCEVRTAGNLYKQSVNGVEAIRAIYTPAQIHPWNTVSSPVLSFSVNFFQNSLGAPNPLPGTNQAYEWKEIFNIIGIIGFALFVWAFALVLLETTYFKTLKSGVLVAARPFPTGKNNVWFWASLVLAAFVSFYSYLILPAIVNQQGFRPTYFLQAPVFFIGVWAVVNAALLAILMLVTWFFFGGRAVSLAERGVKIGWANLWKTIVLSLAVVAAAFSIVFVADALFKVDFRFWVVPLKAFTPDKFAIIGLYLPFFLAFYVIHSIAVNSFNYVEQGKAWVNTALLGLFTVLGALVYVVLQYSIFFATGKSWTEVMTPAVSNIYGIWLFPILLYFPLAVIFDRKLYRVTRNPYLGGIIFALIMTIIACTNTLSQLP